MKAGIIGFGKMGKIRAAELEAYGGVEIKVVYDSQDVDFLNYTVATTPEEIINDPELDIVFVGTPNFLNKELTIAGMQQGKHVFCEKPPAFTGADVEEIQEVEKQTGKTLMYGFNHRHHGSIQKMNELIGDGGFGKVLWMRGRYGKSVDSSFYEGWRAKKEMAGGGILIDQGIHMLDLFLHLGGSFDEVQAMVSSLYWNLPGIEDNVFAQFRNSQTGVVASLHSTMTQWRHMFSLEIFLEKGYMVLNGLKTSSGTYGDEVLSVARNRSVAPAASWDDEEKFTFETNTSWASEIQHFMECVKSGNPVQYGSSDDALRVMKLIDRVYENERHTKEVLYDNLQ